MVWSTQLHLIRIQLRLKNSELNTKSFWRLYWIGNCLLLRNILVITRDVHHRYYSRLSPESGFFDVQILVWYQIRVCTGSGQYSKIRKNHKIRKIQEFEKIEIENSKNSKKLKNWKIWKIWNNWKFEKNENSKKKIKIWKEIWKYDGSQKFSIFRIFKFFGCCDFFRIFKFFGCCDFFRIFRIYDFNFEVFQF